MKKFVAMLLVGLMATAAIAGLDSDPNQLGVYFDTDGNLNCLTSGLPLMVPTNVYVLLMNSTAPVKGFEFSYSCSLPATTYRTGNVITGFGPIDVGNSDNPAAGDYYCGLATARPAAPAMVLVTWTFLKTGDDSGILFHLGPSPYPSRPDGLPVIDGGDDYGLRVAGVSSGDPALPVASTQGDCPVSEEFNSFGSVKSLFR